MDQFYLILIQLGQNRSGSVYNCINSVTQWGQTENTLLFLIPLWQHTTKASNNGHFSNFGETIVQ